MLTSYIRIISADLQALFNSAVIAVELWLTLCEIIHMVAAHWLYLFIGSHGDVRRRVFGGARYSVFLPGIPHGLGFDWAAGVEGGMVSVIIAHLYAVHAFRFCVCTGLTYVVGVLGACVFVSGVNLCTEPTDGAVVSFAGCLVVSELLAVSGLVCWVGGVVVCGLAGCIVNVDVGPFELMSFSAGADSYDDAGCSFSSSLVGV
jgi:hypothetical protein